jgi:hypothetical protein
MGFLRLDLAFTRDGEASGMWQEISHGEFSRSAERSSLRGICQGSRTENLDVK